MRSHTALFVAVLAALLCAVGCSWSQSETAALVAQARQLKQHGKLAEAQQVLEQALAKSPQDADAHYLMAWVFVGREQKLEGAKHFYEVVRISPESQLAKDSRAALGRLGLPDAPATPPVPVATPPTATPAPFTPPTPIPGSLLVADMEGKLGNWIAWPDQGKPRLVPDTEVVRQGKQSGKWDTDRAARFVFTYDVPHDWSKYGCLDLWVHSQKATGAMMLVIPESNSPDTPDRDILRCRVKVDWEGWRELKLYERSFQRAYKPIGFGKVDNIGFDMEMWTNLVKYEPGTVLRFDDLRLLPPDPPGDKLVLFHADTDWGTMYPLLCTREPSRSGGRSAQWDNTIAQPSIYNTSIPRDWDQYSYINLWMHCKEATRDEVVLFVESDAAHLGNDGYRVTFPLDWTGWKLLTFPRAGFVVCNKPMGWDKVTMLSFYTNAYGARHTKGTCLCLDDIWVSKQPPTDEEKRIGQ
jgi:hypothetical protein